MHSTSYAYKTNYICHAQYSSYIVATHTITHSPCTSTCTTHPALHTQGCQGCLPQCLSMQSSRTPVEKDKSSSLMNDMLCYKIVLVQICQAKRLDFPPEALRKMKEASLDISTRELELKRLIQCQLEIRHHHLWVELKAKVLSILFQIQKKRL